MNLKSGTIIFILCCHLVSGAALASQTDSLRTTKKRLADILTGYNSQEKLNAIYDLNQKNDINSLYGGNEKLILDSIITTVVTDEFAEPVNSEKYTGSFLNNGKNVVVKKAKWSSALNMWGNENEYLYDFNDEGNLIQFESREYINSDYRYYTRIEYQYNDGLLHSEILSDRIDEIETWSILERSLYNYDSTQTMNAVYWQKWDVYEESWITEEKVENVYDSIGNLVFQEGAKYNSFTEVWTKRYETVHTYDSVYNLLESITYVPGWEEGTYVPENRTKNTFNADSELIEEIFYDYSYDALGWVAKIRKVYSSFNENEKLYESASFFLNNETQNWEGGERREYFSFHKYSDTDILNWDFYNNFLPMYLFDDLVVDNIINYKYSEGGWLNNGTTTYYFSGDYPVANEELSQLKFSVYPNPAADYLNIETDNNAEMNCIIYNAAGINVFFKTIGNRSQVDVSHLSPGIYILSLQQRGQVVYTQKILKK